MSLLKLVDSQMRRALGQGITAIADYFDVYRLSGTSTGQVITSNNKVISQLQARLTFNTPKPLLEIVPLDKLMYSGMLNTNNLVVGDFLVLTGPDIPNNVDSRIYCLADVRPLEAPVFVRTEFMGYVSRPHSKMIGDEPLLGDGGDIGTNKFQEAVCTLNSGTYSFSNEPGTVPAVIPIGLHQHQRPGEHQDLKYPTATPRAIFYGYVPLLPGVHVQTGDILADATGNRFMILNAYSFETGIQGTQVICESLFS